MTGQETEYKFVLTQTGYETLHAYFSDRCGSCKEQAQKNIYMDSEERELTKNSQMFRIRLTQETILLTHKYDLQVEDGFFQCSQEEKEYPRNELTEAHEILALLPMDTFFERLPTHLEVVGMMDNFRRVYDWNGFQLELDRTTMPNGVFQYELECETHTPMDLEVKIRDLFHELEIEFKPQTKTKYARFLESIQALEDI